MKRVLDQTPPWAVIPVSVLGASLLLGLAHHVLDSGTPPVAKHPSVAALSGPSPQLLPHKECEGAGSAKASDVLTTREGVESRHCLASSDAVSALPPIDVSGRGNAGWHPMNSTGATSARPVALVSTAGYASQARMVEPSPRYGMNVSEWNEMPLIAPVEEVHKPVESSPHGLINSLFLPPDLSSSHEQVEPSTSDASSTTVMEETREAVPTIPALSTVETSDVDLTAPSRETSESLLRLPPIDSSLPEQDKFVSVEGLGGSAEPNQEPTSGELLLLPPMESGQADLSELPPAEALEELVESPLDTMEDVLLPLPPVEATQDVPCELPPTEALEELVESVAETTDDELVPLPPVESSLVETCIDEDEGEPMLKPLPPVEPRLLVPGEPLAIAMFEGLFERVDREAGGNLELKPVMAENGYDKTFVDSQDVLEGEGGQAGVEKEEAPQPLPPVVRRKGGQVAEASATVDAAFSTGQHERSWELELIAREADKHSRRAFDLANKRAYFSARQEFTRALRIIAQGLDTERGTRRHSRALAAGLRALVEAEDFLPKDGHLEAELDLAVISEAHRTPVLRDCDVSATTPLAAIQKYHTYAQEELAEAVGREVAGSMALCGLGKLHIVIGNQQRGDGIAAARSKAMVLLQASLIASPANHMASNELGVLLARNSRNVEARKAFEHSVAAYPTAEAWRNLALTCEQLGQMDEAYSAAQQSLALRANSTGKALATASSRGPVRWVSPAELSRSGGTLRTAAASVPSGRAR